MDTSGDVDDDRRAGLNHQIDDLVRQKQYPLALPLALELASWTSRKCGEESAEYAQEMLRVADVYRESEKFAEAETIYRKVVDLLSNKQGENNTKVSTVLNDLAVTLMGRHDFTAAEPFLRRALAIDAKNGENSDNYIATLSNLGMLKFYEGKYSDAEPLLRRTLEARRVGANRPEFALSLNNLAALYQAIGDTARAKQLFEEALQIRRDHGDPLDIAQSLNNLALLYREIARYRDAERLYKEALEIYRTQLDETHPRFINALSNLAAVYFCLSDFQRAEPLVKKTLEIQRRSDNHAWALGISLNNLATLHYSAGRYDVAEPLYREAITIGRRCVGELHPKLRTRISNLAGMYVAMQRESDAIALMREVMAIDDRLIANVFPIASEGLRITYLAALQQNLDDVMFVISKLSANSRSIVAEGLDIVLRRKGLVAESLAAQRDELLTGRHPTLEPKLRELHHLRSQLAEATLAFLASDGIQTHKDRSVQLEKKIAGMEAELAQELPEVSLENRLKSAERRSVAQALPEGAVLVEFVRFSVRDFGAAPRPESSTLYAAFIVRAGEPDKVRLVDLGEAESIDRLVSQFRESISRAPSWLAGLIGHVRPRTGLDVGEKLRSRIFDPLELSPGDQQQVFLATEGSLAWVPFEALPIANGDYLINRYRISYLSVGRDLLRLGSPSPASSTEAVVIADPNFDLGNEEGAHEPATLNTPEEFQSRDLRSADFYFPRLRGTRTEGERVSQMIGVRPLLWNMAMKSRLKGSRSPRILHLATHGFFLSNQGRVTAGPSSRSEDSEWVAGSDARLAGPEIENPLLRSGLALAGANTWLNRGSTRAVAEDGILNAIEVSSLELVGTELVVLSACETGLGTVHVWEGVFGLRRAFALTGAKTLVMSLWKVEDRQTVKLMVGFYRQLRSGRSRGEALRGAQLELKKRYPSPYYWAAFICQGDPRPLAV